MGNVQYEYLVNTIPNLKTYMVYKRKGKLAWV